MESKLSINQRCLEQKVFYLYQCIGRTPQFDIILPENKCVLYMGKNGI